MFSDVVCPWCFVGTERLERVLAADGLAAEVTFRPFLLSPDTPAEGTDVAAMLRRKYGVDPRVLWQRVESEARTSGLELDLSRQRFSYPTVRAHTLMRHAIGKGTQRALSRALFGAHFQDARNIDDPAVLAAVAAPHGFAPDEVAALLADERELGRTRAEAHSAAAGGITGVPFFVLGGRLALSGAQPEAVFRAALVKAAEGSVAA